MSRRTVDGLNQMMQAVVTEGTARKAMLDFTHSAGKTGTSSSYRDAWFVGFTGALVTGVWIGARQTSSPCTGTAASRVAACLRSVARLHVGGAQGAPDTRDPGPAAASEPGGRSTADLPICAATIRRQPKRRRRRRSAAASCRSRRAKRCARWPSACAGGAAARRPRAQATRRAGAARS